MIFVNLRWHGALSLAICEATEVGDAGGRLHYCEKGAHMRVEQSRSLKIPPMILASVSGVVGGGYDVSPYWVVWQGWAWVARRFVLKVRSTLPLFPPRFPPFTPLLVCTFCIQHAGCRVLGLVVLTVFSPAASFLCVSYRIRSSKSRHKMIGDGGNVTAHIS